MTLAIGTRLGPYEILAPLGAGGMGEVYRAKDSRLGRDVAVKVLPQHLSSNPEVRARFEREAKTVSSLNHPHICTLHDVGREGEIDYLVMELIEGETLAERLTKGPLPTAEVLRTGAQIADALDRAHRAGVMHRDLKPGNVMLTKSGAKLMDFGLARVTGLEGPAGASGITRAALSRSPTMAAPLTAEGTIVGTFQYMAPEQLEGKEADARADLWALGCVLHEMATGRRAFEGASQASLIAAIMHVAPPPVSQVAPLSPPALDRLVSACLAKDPADRIQSVHDVKLQLQWIAEPGSQSGVVAGPVAAVSRSRRGALLSRLSLLVGALGLVAAGVSGYALLSRKPAPMVLQVPAPADLRLSNFWCGAAISPDGASVLGIGARGKDFSRIWLWRLNSPDPVDLAGTEDAYDPCWSPDSRSIAYMSSVENGLYRVPASGGSPTKVCSATDGRGMSWGRKGVIAFAPAASGPLYQVPAGGGTPEPVTTLDRARGEASHRFPCFLPDGDHFLFVTLPPGPRGFPVYVGSLTSKKVQHIMEAECAPIYAEPGYLIFVQSGNVTAQRFDAKRLAVVGERMTIGDAPAPSELTSEPVATASEDGRLLVPAMTPGRSRVEWLDRSGASESVLPLPEGDWILRALSPDQKFAVATRDRDLWLIDLDRVIASRLTRGVGPETSVGWSPDGRRIALDTGVQGDSVIHRLNAAGGGGEDPVRTLPALFQEVSDWSLDGRSLLVAVLGRPGSNGDDTSWDLWTVPLEGGGPPSAYLSTAAVERHGRISPDGKWLFYFTAQDGQVELFIDSYPVPGHRQQILAPEPDRPIRLLWGRDGREVLYSDAQGDLMRMPLEFVGEDARVGKPSRLFRMPAGATALRTRDGEHFLVSAPSGATPGRSLRIILDWTGLVQK